jgi:hypothetical protein
VKWVGYPSGFNEWIDKSDAKYVPPFFFYSHQEDVNNKTN